MNTKRFIGAFAALLLWAGVASAQEPVYEQGELKSYSFIEVQGGVQHPLGDIDFFDGLTPAVGLNIGHYFSPEAGFRIGAFGWQGKSGFESIDQTYKWNFFSANLDLLINLTNLFSKSKSHSLNLIFVGGVGLNYLWDNDELDDIQAVYGDAAETPLRWEDNRLMHNLRAGLRLETNVTKPIGVSLEVLFNNTDDRWNSKTNNQDDWQLTAMIGISWRFGQKYHKKLVPPPPAPVVVEPEPEPEPVVEPEPEPEPEPVVEEPKTIHEEIYYSIRMTEAESSKIETVAKFMNENPDATLTVKGYADAGTGNPTLNAKYAQQRADGVKDALVKKGVSESSMTVTSYGDTVQPFAENDKNRVVIVDGTTAK